VFKVLRNAQVESKQTASNSNFFNYILQNKQSRCC